MKPLQILAAGSLRDVWPVLVAAFSAEYGITTQTHYGPAGLLRQRIEQGEVGDMFVSANLKHPTSLSRQGLAEDTGHFIDNRLCLTARREDVSAEDDWLSLLQRDDLRLATSTPLYDPSGDYTWQLFENIEQRYPGQGSRIRNKANALVGGPDSLPVPVGRLAAQWLIDEGYAELFIGYASYAPRLRHHQSLLVLNIPPAYNVRAQYGWATLSPSAMPLAAFLHTDEAQRILRRYGFLPPYGFRKPAQGKACL
ncbi:substrate-binding domain-containing protein [Pantoea stewartii]|uniref:substrate-binding domain-containing protein n=1 Tax=Pantoea stewartii TaxID=66269 RepID=UPI0025A21E8F|nr:substrate-binding domain-containing protein [Pantoea stewartii]